MIINTLKASVANMNKLLFTVLFSFMAYTAFSQFITISEELPLRNDYDYTILGWVAHDLLLFRDRGHEFYVQAFDGELHVKWEREIPLGPQKADIIGVVATDDRIHIIFGMREKGNYFIRHSSFDHTISLIDTMTLGFIENIFITPRIQMANSEDKSKALLLREDNDGMNLISYDLNTREVIWTNTLKLTGGTQSGYRSMEVNNDGEFYLTIEPDKSSQKSQYIEVFCLLAGVDKFIHEKIDLGDQQVYDFYTQFDNIHNDLVITGLYSDRNVSRAQGFYFIRFRPVQEHAVHLLPFDESLLAEVNGKDVPISKGLTDFNVQKVALRADGGAIVIAELNKEFSRRSSLPVRRDNGSFSRGGWVDYYYEDLILFAIHPDGTPHWKKVLRKRQYSQDDDAIYSSFFLFKTPTQLRFLFNDEIKQENTVGGYEVTGIGNVERKTVFNTDYQKLKLRFKDGLQVAYNECIVPSERNNRLNLVRIQF